MSDAMVIIGAGQAGGRAALTLRGQGFAGPVLLVGAEADAPYERPPLSKGFLTGQQAVADFTFATAAALEAAGIAFRPGCKVEAIDRESRTVRLGSGEQLGYDRLLLATGRRVRRLPVPAAVADRVLYLRDLTDARALQTELARQPRLAIVGGGFIGLELAASARQLAAEVAVIEAMPRLLSRGVPAEVAQMLEARHRAQGVRLHFGARFAAIAAAGVELADGSLVPADLVVVGIGALPNTELAATAGLAIDNGIAVDATLATSDPAIFAAGDCCSFPQPLYDGRRVRLESWRSAQEQGTLAARNMLGAAESITAVPWFWSDQYELSLQIAGLADGTASHVRRELKDGAFVLFHLDADGRLLAASGIGTGNAVAKDIRLAEMLIARRAHPNPADLADPAVNLKRLL